jgi:hypothetical protein
MVGTGVAMGANFIANLAEIAPGNHGIDQAITPAVGEIIFREAESKPIVLVVWQCEVD